MSIETRLKIFPSTAGPHPGLAGATEESRFRVIDTSNLFKRAGSVSWWKRYQEEIRSQEDELAEWLCIHTLKYYTDIKKMIKTGQPL